MNTTVSKLCAITHRIRPSNRSVKIYTPMLVFPMVVNEFTFSENTLLDETQSSAVTINCQPSSGYIT